MYPYRLLLIILSSALLLNCAHTSVVLLDDTLKFPPSEKVEILVEQPTKPFKIIAKLETRGIIRGTSQTTILEDMRQRAKSIGADAIIPFEDASEYDPPGLMYNPWLGGYQTLPGGKIPIIRGYAIKYIETFISNKINRESSHAINYDGSENYNFKGKSANTKKEYLNIQKIYKQYLLLYKTATTPMELNDEYLIIRYEKQNDKKYSYSTIGVGKVIKTEGNKVILKYELFDNRNIVEKNDNVEYVYDKN